MACTTSHVCNLIDTLLRTAADKADTKAARREENTADSAKTPVKASLPKLDLATPNSHKLNEEFESVPSTVSISQQCSDHIGIRVLITKWKHKHNEQMAACSAGSCGLPAHIFLLIHIEPQHSD